MDTGFVNMRGADSVVDDDFVTRRQWLSGGGSGAVGGTPGFSYNDLEFYIDPNDPSSYDGADPPTAITDLRSTYTSAGTVSNVTITNGNFIFNGTTSYIDMGALPSSLENIWAAGGTLEFWIRPEGVGEGGNGFICDTTNTSINGGFLCFLENLSGNTVRFEFRVQFTGTNGFWQLDANRLTLYTWNHVVITYNSDSTTNDPTFTVNDVKLTEGDGLTRTSTPTGAVDPANGHNLYIGNRSANDRTFDGAIGPFRLWTRAVGDVEISRMHQLGFSRYDANLIGYDSNESGIKAPDMVVRAADYTPNSGDARGGDLLVRSGDNTTNAGTGLNSRMTLTTIRGGDGARPAALGEGAPYSMTVRAGDVIHDNNVSGQRSNLLVRGGDITTAVLLGGVGPDAGSVTVRAGNVDSTASGDKRGGNLYLLGGRNGVGAVVQEGNVVVRTGPPATGDTNTSGTLTLTTGISSPGSTNLTGDIEISTGPAGASNIESGAISIFTADVNAFGGAGAGDIDILGGDHTVGVASDGSTVTIAAGDGLASASGFSGGNVKINAGAQLTTGQLNAEGGSIIGVAGDSSNASAGGDGGGVFWTAGDNTANAAAATGGPISLKAGDATGTTAGCTGGNVDIEAGATPNATGTSGDISMVAHANGNDDGAIQWTTTGANFATSEKKNYTAGKQTTDSTPTTIFDFGAAVPNNQNMKVWVHLTAQKIGTGSTGGYMAEWIWSRTFYTDNAGTTQALATQQHATVDNAPPATGWVVNLQYTGSQITLRVIGVAATTINWMMNAYTQIGGMVS